MSKSILLLVVLAAGAFGVVGCAKSESAKSPAPSSQSATKSTLPIYRDAKGQIICPVTGDVIPSVDKAFAFQDYKGTRYYFCCGMCPPKFKADPDKYVVRHERESM